MFFGAKNWLFLAIFALGQAKRVKNTHARCVKKTQAKRVAKQCLYLAGPGVLIQSLLVGSFLQCHA